MRYILPALLMFATPSLAQEGALPMICAGIDPEWSMTLPPSQGTQPAISAQFEYLYSADLTFALATRAQGADWPRAYTFIGRGTSAILLIEPSMDQANTLSARVFTQRGETPILLVGTCTRWQN